LSTSSANDVDRILARMGTQPFGYKHFPKEADAPNRMAEPVDEFHLPGGANMQLVSGSEPASQALTAATTFSLLGDAVPEAVNVRVGRETTDTLRPSLPEPPAIPPASVKVVASPTPMIAVPDRPVAPAVPPPVVNPFSPRLVAQSPPAPTPAPTPAGSLTEMFRMLSKRDVHAGSGAGDRRLPFPFRRP
jgi:hypothetical protein